MTILVNFYNTPGYRTDHGANAVVVTGSSASYPYSSGLGYNIGWDSPSGSFTYHNRTTGGDPRLGGCVYLPSWTNNKFRIELPSAATYDVAAAFGDNSAGYNVHFQFLDNTTQFGSTIGPGYTGGAARFKDATNVERTSASDWVSNNALLTRAFSSTSFFCSRPVSGDLAVLAHVALYSTGGGPTTVVIGQAQEMDSAFAVTRSKIRPIDLATETETALPFEAAGVVIIGQAQESDTAFAMTRTKLRTIDLASETETAFPMTRSKVRTIGLSTESDSAFAFTLRKIRTIGLSTETEEAFPFTASGTKTVLTGLASETDEAFDLSRRKIRTIDLSLETDTAFSARPQKIKVIGLAVETETAHSVSSIPHVLLGPALETDTALPFSARSYTLIGQAVETNIAFPLVRAVVSIPRHEILRYTPHTVPGVSDENLKMVLTYVLEEYARIANVLDLLAQGHVELTFKAPTKPYEGMTRLADGTHWNPGSGKGVYTYFDGTWNKIS